MEELFVIARTLGQTAPYLCAAVAMMSFGFFLILFRGRAPSTQAQRPIKLGFEDRMDALGLDEVDGAWEGTVGGRIIRIARVHDPTEDPPMVLELSTPVPTGGLAVGAGDPELTAVRGSRHVGDAEFDPWFEVMGEPEDVAVLNAEVRRALRNSARNARPRIERGWLTLTGAGVVDVDARIAPLFAVASAVEAAASLDPNHRLKRFAADPEVGVRMRCLEMLQGRGQSPLAISIAKARLEDADPTVRTLAAVILKDSQRLVSIATSAEQPPGVRRRAARALMQTGSDADKMEVAKSLAIGPAPLHSLAFELSSALGAGAEPVLIQLVGSSNEDVAREAAGRLAKTGSIKAIPALREFQERTGALDGLAVRKELAAAIQSIRPKKKSGDEDETRVFAPSHQPTLQDHESPTNWRGVPVVPDEGEVAAGRQASTGERRTPGSRTVRRRG